jgi:hypothetical protein
MSAVFDLFMLYRSSNELESQQFAGRTADYAFAVLFQAVVILVRPALHPVALVIGF